MAMGNRHEVMGEEKTKKSFTLLPLALGLLFFLNKTEINTPRGVFFSDRISPF